MDSSDDNFAWTDASSNSEMALDAKPECESDSVNQRELSLNESKQIKKKAKKRKLADLEDDNKQIQNGKIKSEPESDLDFPKKKKKKQNESKLSNDTSKDTLEDIDNYLNIRVKQEQESFVETTETIPKKKKKHRNNHDANSNGLKSQESGGDGSTSIGNNDISENDQIDDYLNFRVKQEQESFVEPTEIKHKKKKKHNKSLDTSISDNYDLQSAELYNQKNDSELDNKNSVSDSVLNIKEEKDVNKKKKKKSKKKQEDLVDSDNIMVSDNKSGNISKLEISENNADSSKYDESTITQITNVTGDRENMSVHEDTIEKEVHSDSIRKTKNKLIKKRESKTSESSESEKEVTKQNKSISDRLRFEDEDTTDFTSVQNTLNKDWPKQIKNFVKFRKNISHASLNMQENHFVSEDDDVWIIKCPHEFDIKDFINVNLTLDSKCKIKLNGQTYDGALDDSIERLPVLAYDKATNKPVVKSIPVMGLTKFRKRIPKPHIPDQGVLANNQNNFIPLPETKCRHPLFGANYKKAIKIPSAIAERLNGHNGSIQESSPIDTCKPKKKKHKKEKCKLEHDDNDESATVPAQPPAPAARSKRKRNHSGDADGARPACKRIRQDPHPAEAWDSEQAIQNNLFGFE